MDFKYNEEMGLTQIVVHKGEDICVKCSPEIREICPLLMSIIQNFVYPCANHISMNKCCMYDAIHSKKKKKSTRRKDVT